MINKVIIEGTLARKPYMTETEQGTKKALFTLEVKTYEEGATKKYIPAECYGKQADKIENLIGGETIYLEGKLYTYKSTKYDTTMLVLNADRVEIAPFGVSAFNQEQEEVIGSNNTSNVMEVSFDDLPF